MGYRKRSNDEIYTLYNEQNIVEEVRKRRLQWLDNIERMADKRTVKKVAWRETAK